MVLGQYCMDAYELQSAGYIKPGSAPMIVSLIQKGMPMAKALPRNVFTGRQGGHSFESMRTNVNAQADAVAINLENAQVALTNAGLITGKESPTAIAGVVKAAAKVGVATTLAAVKASVGKGRNLRSQFPKSKPNGTIIPTNVSSSAVQPSGSAVSKTINRNTTAALQGSSAQEASQNPLTSSAVKQGGGVIKIPTGGSDNRGGEFLPFDFFNGLNINIFAAENEEALKYLSSPSTALTFTPTSVGGLTNKALGAATSAATGAAGGLQGKINQALGQIGSGNMAAGMADGITSGLGSLKDSLAGLSASKGLSSLKDQAKGIAAGAFNAIKQGFPKMPAGVPVDVAKVAKEAAAKAEAASSSVAGSAVNKLSALGNAGSALGNAAKDATSKLQNSLSGGAAALGKNLSASAGGALSSLGNAASSLGGSGALSSLGNAASSLGGGVAGALAAAGGNPLSGATSKVDAINSKLDSASKTLNAVTGLTPTNAVSAFGSVKDSVLQAPSQLVSNKLASTAVGTLSSGLSNLPGGAGAAGALVNNAKNLLSGDASAAKGKLGAAAGKLGSLSNGLQDKLNKSKDLATSKLNNLKPPKLDSAALLSKAGIPSGLASQLQSQISAISSGGGVPVSMPVIAINTTNRAAITAAVDSLIEDPGIPKPNLLGEVSEATVSTFESGQKAIKSKASQVSDLALEYDKAQKASDKAFAKFKKAVNTLPAGDPKIEALRQEGLKLLLEAEAKEKAFRKAGQEAGFF